jgi:hypothetical protein
MKKEFYIEYFGEQVPEEELIETAKKIWADAGNKPADLKDIKLYLNVEEDAVYYVMNNNFTGNFHVVNTHNDF